eukprot:12418119-Karenia_brevis.AAC.1
MAKAKRKKHPVHKKNDEWLMYRVLKSADEVHETGKEHRQGVEIDMKVEANKEMAKLVESAVCTSMTSGIPTDGAAGFAKGSGKGKGRGKGKSKDALEIQLAQSGETPEEDGETLPPRPKKVKATSGTPTQPETQAIANESQSVKDPEPNSPTAWAAKLMKDALHAKVAAKNLKAANIKHSDSLHAALTNNWGQLEDLSKELNEAILNDSSEVDLKAI